MGAQWKAKGKELAANARGRVFGKLAKEIMVAARGGADPAGNARLRLLVEQARKVSMPKDTLDRAIKKGSGTGTDAVHFEHVIYEGFAPHRVPLMVECLTDNHNRTASEVRVLFSIAHPFWPIHGAENVSRHVYLRAGTARPFATAGRAANASSPRCTFLKSENPTRSPAS